MCHEQIWLFVFCTLHLSTTLLTRLIDWVCTTMCAVQITTPWLSRQMWSSCRSSTPGTERSSCNDTTGGREEMEEEV